MAPATFTLRATYNKPNGEPQIQSRPVHIYVTGTKQVKDTAGNVIISGRVEADVVDGVLTVPGLPDPRDPGYNPDNFGLTVSAVFRDNHPPAVSFGAEALDAHLTNGVLELEDVTPVDPSTFTPNATYADASTVTALDSRVTTVESDVAGKADSADLATVATTGNYTDLSGQPAIPTTAADVGALPDTTQIPSTPGDVGAEPAGLSTTTNDALAATYAGRNLNTVALLGDSITERNTPIAGSNNSLYKQRVGYWHWANFRLGQRMKVVSYAGISGDTTTQMLARLDTDILAHEPGWCVVTGGHNDITSGATAAQITGNLTAIYDALLSAGIRVAAGTLTPRTGLTAGQTATLYAVNRWLREYARDHKGIVLADWFPRLADTTGAPKAGYTNDGLHPDPPMAAVMGDVLAAALDPHVPAVDVHPLPGDPTNLLANPLMTGTGGALTSGVTGSVATSWSTSNAGSFAATASKVARTDGIPGEWQQLTVTGGTGLLYAPATAVPAAGTNILGLMELQVDSGYANVARLEPFLYFSNTGAVGDIYWNDAFAGALTALPKSGLGRTSTVTLPSGLSYVRLMLRVGVTGTGPVTVRVGRTAIMPA